MSRDTRRYLLVFSLLALAALAVLVIYQLESIRGQASVDSGFQLVADIDNWRRTDRERALSSEYDFSLGPQLHELPLELGGWQGEDIPQTNLEVFILLEPEEYVYRRYERDGQLLWLSLIGSRKSKSFHPPQICYSSDGWTTEVSSEPIPVGSGDLYALKVLATKGNSAHVVLYFFIWPDVSREPSLGTVLFKVTAPMRGTAEDTLAIEREFIQQFFTDVE